MLLITLSKTADNILPDCFIALTSLAVLGLVVSRDVSKGRLLARGRSDDNEEGIQERFRAYDTKVAPILEFFKSQNIQVHDIDGDRTPEVVHEDIMKCLNR